jgi:tryptophan 2,3-dioxygenase
MKNEAAIARFAADSIAANNLQRRLAEPSVWQSFLRYLKLQDVAIPAAALERDPTLATEADPAVQEALIAVYRRDAAITQVCERLVDLDEGVQEWRYRHVKMVQRTIGTKPGTGGSAGAEYLKSTLFRPVFPDLWAIRAAL